MRKIVFIVTAFFAAAVLSGCADKVSDNDRELEQQSLDTWMSMHVNKDGQTVAEKLTDGMYIEWVERVEGGVRPTTGDYVDINYTGFYLAGYDVGTHWGNVFMTRSEEIARMEGTFAVYTHYVPQFLVNNNANYIMPGMQMALNLIRKGEKVRLYLPSWEANFYGGLTYDNGYGGQSGISASYGYASFSAPVIVDLELVNVYDATTQRDEDMVEKYVEDHWGNPDDFALWTKDNENGGVEKKVEDFFVNHTKPGDGKTIDGNSTIPNIYYVGKFLDGFVFDTNIDTVATRLNRTASSAIANYMPSTTSSSLINAFGEVFLSDKIKFNSAFTMVFSSSYGYTYEGKSGEGVTFIQPYEPLIFEIIVSPEKEE